MCSLHTRSAFVLVLSQRFSEREDKTQGKKKKSHLLWTKCLCLKIHMLRLNSPVPKVIEFESVAFER